MGNPEAEQMRETVIYDETIAVGDPVYLTGPAIGVAIEAGVATNKKEISTFGRLNNTDTTGLSINDDLYVASGGGMTATKPTGTNKVQVIARVIKVNAVGNIYIIGAGRVNDIPNLAQDKVWKGNASGVPTETDVSIIYDPTGIEFGNTDQEYDVDGTTWVTAVAGGTLGGIPDETSTGHKLADCLSAIDTARDGSYLAIREDTGAASATNPNTVHFLFESVVAFDTVDMLLFYNGGAAHVMGIELWDWGNSAWVRIQEYTDHAFYIDYSIKVHGSSVFVGTGGDDGDVKLQLIHDNAGNNAHNLLVDYMTLFKGL
jgi:hypothetical protein